MNIFFKIIKIYFLLFTKIKRRETEKEMEEREDAEMRLKKAETDQLFFAYQQEKDRKRHHDAQALAELHLRQVVSYHNAINIT